MAMMGGVGRRAMSGTMKSDTSLAQSDQPTAESAMPRSKPLVEQIAGQKLAGRIKSLKIKVKMKDKKGAANA